MGGKSSPPASPDYRAAAQETAEGNLDAARVATKANRPTLITPWGRQDWDVKNDKWTGTVTMDDGLQAALDSQINVDRELSQNAEAMLNQITLQDREFDMSGVTDKADPGFAGVEGVRDAMMGRLREDLDYGREREVSRLATQGITRGSEAYNKAMERLDRQETDANQQALLASMGEADRIYGRQTGARSRDIQEQAYLRGLPISELNALLRGTDVSMPQFQQYASQATTSGPNMMAAAQAQGQSDLDAYNAKQAQGSNFLSGLTSIGKLGVSAYTGGMFG